MNHPLAPIPLVYSLPVVVLLLCILFLPWLYQRFWNRNLYKAIVVALLSALTWHFFGKNYGYAPFRHRFEDYFSLLCWISSIYIIAGGIVLRGLKKSSPLLNTLLLAAGALIANFIGGIGATVLMLVPFLRANQSRQSSNHLIVFFIILVTNLGAILTPVDYLFAFFFPFYSKTPHSLDAWHLKLLPFWLASLFYLLVHFYWLDRLKFKKENQPIEKLRNLLSNFSLRGIYNFLLLIGAGGAYFFPTPYRESLLFTLAGCSLMLTSHELRNENAFSFKPMVEVAILLFGISITAIPVINILSSSVPGSSSYFQSFWLSGISASLFNKIPAFAAFAQLGTYDFLWYSTIFAATALFGTLTYFGNVLNLMVRTMTHGLGLKTPSYIVYLAWAGLALSPILLVISIILYLH